MTRMLSISLATRHSFPSQLSNATAFPQCRLLLPWLLHFHLTSIKSSIAFPLLHNWQINLTRATGQLQLAYSVTMRVLSHNTCQFHISYYEDSIQSLTTQRESLFLLKLSLLK